MSEIWAQATETSLPGRVHWLQPLTRRWFGARWRPRLGLWSGALPPGLVPPCSAVGSSSSRSQGEASIPSAPRAAPALLGLPVARAAVVHRLPHSPAWAWARSRVHATRAGAREQRGVPYSRKEEEGVLARHEPFF